MTPSGHPYATMINNPAMVDLYAANSESLGRAMPRETQPDGGSSDMGNVSHIVPSIHPMLAIECGDSVNHQPEFAAHTIEPSGDRAIRDGALAMAYTIIDMAEQHLWSRL